MTLSLSADSLQANVAAATTKQRGFRAPIGVVIWSPASDELDRRLEE
jgi:hypothetical protein